MRFRFQSEIYIAHLQERRSLRCFKFTENKTLIRCSVMIIRKVTTGRPSQTCRAKNTDSTVSNYKSLSISIRHLCLISTKFIMQTFSVVFSLEVALYKFGITIIIPVLNDELVLVGGNNATRIILLSKWRPVKFSITIITITKSRRVKPITCWMRRAPSSFTQVSGWHYQSTGNVWLCYNAFV